MFVQPDFSARKSNLTEHEVGKLAPIGMESPQLQLSICVLASEDLEWKAGPKFL